MSCNIVQYSERRKAWTSWNHFHQHTAALHPPATGAKDLSEEHLKSACQASLLEIQYDLNLGYFPYDRQVFFLYEVIHMTSSMKYYISHMVYALCTMN